MILFTIKKAFFDIWDNLFTIVLLNIGFLIVLAAGGGLLQLLSMFSIHMAVFFLGIGVATFLLVFYTGAIAMLAGDMADYRFPEFKRFLNYLKTTWKASCVFSLLLVFQLLIFLIIIPWYLGKGGVIGISAAAVLFWASVFWWFASQYYFPVSSRLDKNIKPALLKSFALFFDNTGFTIALALGTLIMLILSGLTAFLFPGIGSILVWHQVGTKLRVYKYDYLETHPGASKKRIPWETLLKDDRRKVGKRTLKGMIFPWKG